IALEGTDVVAIGTLLKGPTVIATSKDPVAAPKVAIEFAKTNEQFVILGGSMGKTVLNVDGVKALASLPSLDELRGKIVGLLVAPATKLAQLSNAPAAKLARVIQAHASKGEAACPFATHQPGLNQTFKDTDQWLTCRKSSTTSRASPCSKRLNWPSFSKRSGACPPPPQLRLPAPPPAALPLLPPKRRPSSRSFWLPPATRRSRSSR